MVGSGANQRVSPFWKVSSVLLGIPSLQDRKKILMYLWNIWNIQRPNRKCPRFSLWSTILHLKRRVELELEKETIGKSNVGPQLKASLWSYGSKLGACQFFTRKVTKVSGGEEMRGWRTRWVTWTPREESTETASGECALDGVEDMDRRKIQEAEWGGLDKQCVWGGAVTLTFALEPG
jgi:hypothetical protein